MYLNIEMKLLRRLNFKSVCTVIRVLVKANEINSNLSIASKQYVRRE